MPELVVLGTGNRKKAVELAFLFAPLGVELRTLADYPAAMSVAETGSTFAENARLKATQQARHLGAWVLGEDSGLAVDALDGRPGVFSARYSGVGATDAANNHRLLEELGNTRLESRTAHYVCHMALADPQGLLRGESVGRCSGRILTEPRGSSGFGYDPLFEIVEYHRTFAELGPVVKATLSHRARAAAAMARLLGRL